MTLSITGCKTRQKITPTEGVKKESTAKAKPTTVQIKTLNYEWLSYRMALTLSDYSTQKEKMNVSAFFVNRKDSIIYITLGKLGFEGVRVVITPDSVKYMNHLDKSYYCGDYSLVNRLLGIKVNFYLLQAIFAGEDIPGFEPNTFLMMLQQDTAVYSAATRRNKAMGIAISQELKTDTNHKLIENNITELQTGVFIGMKYGNFIPVDGSQLFFQQAKVVVPSEKILLDCKLKSIKLNEPGPTSIKIPDKYKPLEVR